ncbi:endoplasmic reticulum membrane-associated RNA degradation protein isoform X2 [Microcaecilia unicolor]|uniref:Endoplasmic reticulum membrane-associated RNA degradation protein isoform X2 n=1 Tax=Microcaecilia unicolor TaxID=1415580 RepID=A0A6P7X9I7_9AMPH|nr:endoplasmic reticulum membrane-associated RNA degradation protein isoform X2 [Microcaecilia unicolor]
MEMFADPVVTCLSPAVHNIVCNLGFESDVSHDINSIVSGDCEICWKSITKHLHYAQSGEGQDVDYIASVRSLGPLCEAVHVHLLALTRKQFEEKYGQGFQWTNSTELFIETFDILKNLQAVAIALSLMKLTSCLERALGNVYLLVGKVCPFLLRDLLASLELATVFGQSVMDVLKVFLGSPRSLNLRNILWHGFSSPQEIPTKYCSMLLLLTAGLGQLLNTYLMEMNVILAHRPYVSFTNLKDLSVFPDITVDMLSVTEDLVEESSFVIKPMLPFWRASVTAFKECRYADCMILLLSQLETGLRLVFTRVNKCPGRLLTAEVLAKHLNDEELNQLPLILGEPAMEFLWDFLSYQEGPRVRDHLSHGEINLNAFPKEIANQMLAFSIVLLNKFLGDEHTALKDNAIIAPLINCAGCYRSQFHPVARLGKQVLDCTSSINRWAHLPVPSLEQMQELAGSTGAVASSSSIPEALEVLSLLKHRMPPDYCFLEDMGHSLLTDMWLSLQTYLCTTPMDTLYCPRPILEAVTVLRKITVQCHLVSEQIIASAELRYLQWVDKALRSRQRHNYIRMLKSITFLSPMLRLLLMVVALDRISIYSICEKTTSEYQQYLKYLKSILQYTENLATYTSPEKNKWDETLDLSQRALIKIKVYNEKRETC